LNRNCHKSRLLGIVLLLTSFVSTNAAFSQADVYLKIYSRTFQRMQVDLYPFSSKSSTEDAEVLAALITDVLKNDLWMSGYVKVNLKFGTPGDGVSAANGGAAIARVGGVFEIAGNSVTIKPEVIDQASGRTIIRSDYREASDRERKAIHRIADDIVYMLSGDRGIANSKVAYVHEKSDGSKEIAAMDYDGRNMTILTSNGSINLSPAWSPDGHKICYTSFKDDNPNLYVLNLRTKTQFRLSALRGLNSAPAWSPDGSRLALTLSKDGNAEIYLLDVETKKLQRLTYNNGIDSSPSWAPSNREIAFTSDRAGSPQVYLMDADGLNVRRLTFEGSYNDSPAWSPRGDKIAYVSRTDSGFDIYTIDVTGENIMRLTDSSSSNEDPCWSPNGFAIMFSSNREGGRALYSMFWDGTGQKRLTSGGVNYMPAWSAR